MRPHAVPVLLVPALILAAASPIAADEVKPYRAEELKPDRAEELKPYSAPAAQPGQSGREIERLKPAGVDPTPSQGPLDPKVVGAWAVEIPGVAWTDRFESGATRTDVTHVGAGAGLGTLRIERGGAYRWLKRGRAVSRGHLAQVVPRSGAAPGRTYYLVRDDRTGYYLCADGGELTLYSPGTNLFAARGRPTR